MISGLKPVCDQDDFLIETSIGTLLCRMDTRIISMTSEIPFVEIKGRFVNLEKARAYFQANQINRKVNAFWFRNDSGEWDWNEGHFSITCPKERASWATALHNRAVIRMVESFILAVIEIGPAIKEEVK